MDSSQADWEVSAEPQQFGPYMLHELINRGGMSEIWYATNPENQPVAIRRLHSVGTFDFTTKSRFVSPGGEAMPTMLGKPTLAPALLVRTVNW